MNFNRTSVTGWLLTATTLLLTACGGGPATDQGTTSPADTAPVTAMPAPQDMLGLAERIARDGPTAPMRRLHALSASAAGDTAATATAVATAAATASPAEAAPRPSIDEMMDWAEVRYPALFPRHMARAEPVDFFGVRYCVRYYPGSGHYIGITPLGDVFGVGPVTGGALVNLGTTSDYAPWIAAERCTVYPGRCQPPADDAPRCTYAPVEPAMAAPSGRGELRQADALPGITLAELQQAVAVPGTRISGLQPRYGVRNVRLHYLTLDGQGREVVASGLLSVPDKPWGDSTPVLAYQHGTIMFDAEAPTNAIAADQPPIVLASLGYVVVAADYVGYGLTKGEPHPYLLSAPTAAAVNDLLTAARWWRQQQRWPGDGRLVLAGYSEGGYATAAAHRALQADGALHLDSLVASVTGGGPLDVGTTLDRLLERQIDRNPLFALIRPGFLRHLGSTLRDEVRRALLRALLPGDSDVVFQSTFIDNFLADDVAEQERASNVHDWAPIRPLSLFHGREDQTVPYEAALSAWTAMRARGADPAFVTLTDCSAVPSGHLECVPEFVQRLVDALAVHAPAR